MKTNDGEAVIRAGKHFGIHQWPKLRHAALRLAMAENELKPEHRDSRKIRRILRRFRVGEAFSFYAQRPDLWKPG